MNLFKKLFRNPRNRVNKLYVVIKKANDELSEIRKECKHKTWHAGNYSYRIGNIQFGGLCDTCDEWLGEALTLKDWWENFLENWENEAKYNQKKPELMQQKAVLNFNDPFRQKFYLKTELDKDLKACIVSIPKEMEEYFIKWGGFIKN